jgi:hypothetical protein
MVSCRLTSHWLAFSRLPCFIPWQSRKESDRVAWLAWNRRHVLFTWFIYTRPLGTPVRGRGRLLGTKVDSQLDGTRECRIGDKQSMVR